MTLCGKHEELIDQILVEEEDVTEAHKHYIDDFVSLIKEEMKLIYEVQKPKSDINEYVASLHSILQHKVEMSQILMDKVANFGNHLKEEELISKKFSNL